MAPPAPQITARLVVHREVRGWILEKFATRLAEHLLRWGVTADIADRPSPATDINHWLLYYYGPDERSGPSTMLITHIDRAQKLRLLKPKLALVDVGICVSRMTVQQLRDAGLPAAKLTYVTPGCDGLAEPRRIVVATSSRVYADSRKRELLLVRLAHAMRLDLFEFVITGQGWERIVEELRAAGAAVHYEPGTGDFAGDYQAVRRALSRADYYLYMGLDEGSMGLLDALAAGVATIATPQGYHLDVPHALTHPFVEFAELRAVFEQLAAERRQRIESVRRLSWDEYARRHALLWRAILEGRVPDYLRGQPPGAAGIAAAPPTGWQVMRRWGELYAREGAFYGRQLLRRLTGV